MSRKINKRPARRTKSKRRASASKKNTTGLSSVNIRTVIWGLLVGFVIAGVFAGHMWLKNPQHLTLQTVTLDGAMDANQTEQLQALLAPIKKDNLYNLDEQTLITQITDLEWVNSAQIEHLWPQQLKVNVKVQNLIAFWGKDAMLNSNGDILPFTRESMEGKLPTLFSPYSSSLDTAKKYIEAKHLLAQLPMKIVRFEVDYRNAWTMTFANGMNVIVGQKNRQQKLDKFVAAYQQELQHFSNKVGTIDLRYMNGFTVSWADSAS